MELDFHRWLKHHLPGSDRMLVPLGDDAAVLRWPTTTCVMTSDMLADGVHFDLNRVPPERVGRKCLAVNLSDIAAMAATPVAAIISLMLPRKGAADLARRLYEGVLPLAEEFGTLIAGGDTNTWDGALVVNVALFGESSPKGDLRRDGACVDDLLLVSGSLGGSLEGHHYDFQPRVKLAQYLHREFQINACMDLSDGLSTDATRMAAQSGCGIEVDLTGIPISDAARRMSKLDPSATPLERALGDGEDFELLLAVPPDEANRLISENQSGVPLTIVGRCVDAPGVWFVDDEGRRQLCPILGYEHGGQE